MCLYALAEHLNISAKARPEIILRPPENTHYAMVRVRLLEFISCPAVKTLLHRIAVLPCWSKRVDPQPLAGGLTNHNFRVQDCGQAFVVRVGKDLPEHGVLRSHEINASRAAWLAGLAPEIIYTEPSIMVMRFIEGRVLQPTQVQNHTILPRLLTLIQTCHQKLAGYLAPGVLGFWVFQVNRSYVSLLTGQATSPYSSHLPALLQQNDLLEQAVGAVQLVFSHNDLLAANFIDDGSRLWLLDWEYAGLNSPLFDLANLAANNALSEDRQRWLLQHYFSATVDDSLWNRYQAMKCASLLRESLWSMVAEQYSTLDYNYTVYTQKNLARYRQAWLQWTEVLERP